MGAWGTGIFQDDTACDVRDDYRDHLGMGLSGPEASSRILAQYASSLNDPEQSGVIWLALAATQWKLGRLEPTTLEKAIHVIDSGSDLARWNTNSRDRARRNGALQKLRGQLTSPPPAPRKVRRPVVEVCLWEVGNLVSYRLLSGKIILFRVISLSTDKGGTYPSCEILDWSGDVVPLAEQLRSIPIRKSGDPRWNSVTRLMLLGSKKTVKDRLKQLDMTFPPEQQRGRANVVLWRELDAKLADWFELR